MEAKLFSEGKCGLYQSCHLKWVFLAPCKQHSCPGGCQTHVIPLIESSVFLNKFLNHILKFATLLLSSWYHQETHPIAWELSSEPTSFCQISSISSSGIETAALLHLHDGCGSICKGFPLGISLGSRWSPKSCIQVTLS